MASCLEDLMDYENQDSSYFSLQDMLFPGKQSIPFIPSAATLPPIQVKAPAQESCLLPLNQFCYMRHVYKEEIKQIETKNKLKIVAQVHVTFEAEQKDGRPHEALCEFTDLSQSSVDFGEAVIPLKFVDPDQWSDALKVIKRNKDKLLLTMSSEEVIVSGPKQSQDEFSAVLNAMQKTKTPVEQNKPPSVLHIKRDQHTKPPRQENSWKSIITCVEDRNINQKFYQNVKSTKTPGSRNQIANYTTFGKVINPIDSLSINQTQFYRGNVFSGSLNPQRSDKQKENPLTRFSILDFVSGVKRNQPEGTMMSNKFSSPFLATMSSDELTVFGPSCNRDDLASMLNTTQTTGENKMTAENCVLSVNQYLYVSHIYKEELSCILDENKVEMKEEVHVNFESKSQDGKPTEASTKFIDIVQKSFPDCYGSVFSVKSVHPDQLNRALNAIMKNDKKLLVTMSSNEITVFGPRCNQDDLDSMLNTTHKTDTALKESEWPSSPQNFNDDVCLKISMTIKDDLTEAGLTIDKSQWKKLMTSSVDQLEKIQAKYNVDFNESSISEGKVKIKASYKGYRGNPAMESHAVRALLHLYQKMMTSSQHLPPPYSATRGSEGASSEAGLNDDSKQNGEESATGGATGDTKDDKCSICLSEFTDKKQLKCKHEFCSECLRNAVKHCGHICPICKDVFGEMNGNQPDGKMTWDTVSYSLPGFPNFGHIRITYNIPSGKQMKHHPNPGKHYVATCRTAYLPDNKEGNEVLQLLKKAFDQKLIFTVGASRTTGADNMVTWNDIHHKTSMTGGPEGFGYPDPTYLSRVKEELKAKGIK